MPSQSDAFYLVVAVSFVLCENNPGSFCYILKPNFIWRAAREVVPLALVLDTITQQDIENRLAVVEVLIQVKDEIVKLQLLGFPSELPLRSAFLRGHIPWLVRALTRVR